MRNRRHLELASRAGDVRLVEWNARGKSKTEGGKWVKGVRWCSKPRTPVDLPARRARRSFARHRRLFRAFLLGEELRLLYHLDAPDRRPSTAAWLRWASRSKLRPFVKLARTIRRHREGILAAIRLGLSGNRVGRLMTMVGFAWFLAPLSALSGADQPAKRLRAP